jgi:hypothetical protein
MGLLPIDEEWANHFFLVSSKNDSLLPIEDAINRQSDTSAEDVPDEKPERGKGEANPANDTSTND